MVKLYPFPCSIGTVEHYKSPQLSSKSCIFTKSAIFQQNQLTSTMVCPLAVAGITVGAVIFIQSGSGGRWMDAYSSNPVRFTTESLEHIQRNTGTEWAKWIVIRPSGLSTCDVIMLESVRYRGQYLDARPDRSVYVSSSSNPSSHDWTKWKLTKDGSYYYLESVRHSGYYLEMDRYNPGWWASAYYRAHLSSGKGTSTRMKVHEC